jgi:hypothetical protein
VPGLKVLRIDECNNLSDVVINAPKVENILIQNCQRLLSASLSGRCLTTVSFRKTDSLFMLSSTDGCPFMQKMFFAHAIDVQVVCRAFCQALKLQAQIFNREYLIIEGELQMRHVGGEM